jgi:peptidyl-prolyl cis-trans isomerase C
LVANQHEAEDVQRLLTEGQEFGALAHKFSTCPSSRKDGDLGLISLQRLDQTFADAAAKLQVDEISPVIKTRFGYHLIQRQGE